MELKTSQRYQAILKIGFQLLNKRDRTKLILINLLQIYFSLLDLISLTLLGLLVSLSLFGIQSKTLPENLENLLNLIGLGTFEFQIQVAILGSISGLLLVSKTFLMAYLSKKVIYFLNIRSATISAEIMAQVLLKPYDFTKARSPAVFLYSVNTGIQNLLVVVLGSVGIILNELVLLSIMAIVAFAVDPLIFSVTLAYFGIFAILQSRKLNEIAQKDNSRSAQLSIDIDRRILESFYLYKEMHIRGARRIGLEELIKSKIELAKNLTNITFLPYVTKYSMEILLVLGGFVMASVQFLIKDAVSAITSLALFIVVTSRISPAILRLQQAFLQFRTGIGGAESALELLESLKTYAFDSGLSSTSPSFKDKKKALLGKIVLKDVDFRYWDGEVLAIKNLNLEVFPGEMLAIIGPSGNGKSTLLDLIMGAILPSKGQVLIDNLDPNSFIEFFPGAIGYVAQESVFSNASIRDNILLGLDNFAINDEEIWRALSQVGLDVAVKAMQSGLDSQIGERGLMLSVGQRQRLSLARALITKPRILLLDEPTSSLDSDSEKLISNLIYSLKSKTTIVVIAHRLKTIREADRIIVMKEGKIVEELTKHILDGGQNQEYNLS